MEPLAADDEFAHRRYGLPLASAKRGWLDECLQQDGKSKIARGR